MQPFLRSWYNKIMRHSLEHLSSSRNMDISRDPEGIKNAGAEEGIKSAEPEPPKSFAEHMKELENMINSLPTNDEKEINNAIKNLARNQAIEDARNAVLQTFGQPAMSDENQAATENQYAAESQAVTSNGQPIDQSDRPKVNIKKPIIKVYDKYGNVTEAALQMSKTHTSWFNRYPEQTNEVGKLMHESYERGKPLKVLNIGVSQGQEAMGYIQMASNLAGEDKINNALDLELVEHAVEIPITKDKLPENISESSRDYLKNLYQTDKAHFGTPFQKYVKELKDKGEKRDVVLFNNVIQHLDYKNKTSEEMSKDMENLADIVDTNGLLCITCEGQARRHQKVDALINSTTEMLKTRGFYEESNGVFRKLPENLSEISTAF